MQLPQHKASWCKPTDTMHELRLPLSISGWMYECFWYLSKGSTELVHKVVSVATLLLLGTILWVWAFLVCNFFVAKKHVMIADFFNTWQYFCFCSFCLQISPILSVWLWSSLAQWLVDFFFWLVSLLFAGWNARRNLPHAVGGQTLLIGSCFASLNSGHSSVTLSSSLSPCCLGVCRIYYFHWRAELQFFEVSQLNLSVLFSLVNDVCW